MIPFSQNCTPANGRGRGVGEGRGERGLLHLRKITQMKLEPFLHFLIPSLNMDIHYPSLGVLRSFILTLPILGW